MPGAKSSRKGLKICCGTTFVLLIVLAIVCVTLYFTMFKPKKPQVTAHPVSLENIEVQIFPAFSLNVTIGLVFTINNRNYGSFKYQNSTCYIDYHGTNIAEVPIEGGTVPARRKFNLSTYANVTAEHYRCIFFSQASAQEGTQHIQTPRGAHGFLSQHIQSSVLRWISEGFWKA
ncbi:uncharacterized protein LOC131330697 [Rhododendron vialii]|uniref:uncharacterized protein LOC131330697 n=1 Tax=Rhododendron vialii TaxID=182163 RepID=UPI0026601611|nr:uncharacterized protein LOC131330697 [Rhododendron vialii]